MTDLISSIQTEFEPSEDLNEEEEDTSREIETTSAEYINKSNSLTKAQASKEVAQFKNLTNVYDINDSRLRVSSLNNQQRKLFDDITERS